MTAEHLRIALAHSRAVGIARTLVLIVAFWEGILPVTYEQLVTHSPVNRRSTQRGIARLRAAGEIRRELRAADDPGPSWYVFTLRCPTPDICQHKPNEGVAK